MSKTGRNDPCPCGSSRKYKHCCLRRARGVRASLIEEQKRSIAVAMSNVSNAQEFARGTGVNDILALRRELPSEEQRGER